MVAEIHQDGVGVQCPFQVVLVQKGQRVQQALDDISTLFLKDLLHLHLLGGEGAFTFMLLFLILSIAAVAVVKLHLAFSFSSFTHFGLDLNLKKFDQQNSEGMVGHVGHQ